MGKAIKDKLIAAVVAVLLLTLYIYWPGLNGPFLLDDMTNIVQAQIDASGLDAFLYTATHNTSGMLGRSVAAASFALTNMFYGLEPWGYKFHNLLLHLLTSVLLFRLLYVLLGALDQQLNHTRQLMVAGITASFWLLHPLQVSTVLYAVQRMTQLATLFTIIALLLYLAIRLSPKRDLRWYLLAFLAFPLSMLLAGLSKETGALIPCYIVVLEWLLSKKEQVRVLSDKPLSIFLGVFVALPLFIGLVYGFTHFDSIANYSNRDFSLVERLLTQLHVVAWYVGAILLPRVDSMSLYHDDFALTTSLDPVTGLLLLALLAVLVVIVSGRKRWPILSLGLALFLVSHLLESTFIPLELMFEHRNYFAAAGLLLPLVYYCVCYLEQKVWALLLGLCLLILLAQTYIRVMEWESEDMLLTLAATQHAGSSRAQTAYANYLFAKNRSEEAFKHLALAYELHPEDSGPLLHQLLHRCIFGQSRPDLYAQSLQALGEYPVTVYALNTLEGLIVATSREECSQYTFDEIEALVEQALALPANQQHQLYYGFLLRYRGMITFLQNIYAPGVVAMRESYAATGMVSILAELVKYELDFGQPGDAEDTLNLIREINEERFGAESYQIELLEKMLADYRIAETETPPQ